VEEARVLLQAVVVDQTGFGIDLNVGIGVWRGVSKGVEDSRRPPTRRV
jgi:hypothetical protein